MSMLKYPFQILNLVITIVKYLTGNGSSSHERVIYTIAPIYIMLSMAKVIVKNSLHAQVFAIPSVYSLCVYIQDHEYN